MEKQCSMTCKYVSMYKFYQSSGLLCIIEDVAQVFCYTHKMFQKFDVQDRSQPGLDFMKCEYCRCK